MNEVIDGLISIVMPVYNTGKYLNECIDSILKQTYEKIELICVDDCSTDSLTTKILKKIGEQDKRISVLWLTEQTGAGEARNIGMDSASGEYIMFLDSDDYYEFDMLEKMLETMQKNPDADICLCNALRFDDLTGRPLKEIKPNIISERMRKVFALEMLPDEGINSLPGGPCTKLIRRSLLVSNKIRFQSLSSHNDVSFHIEVLLNAKGIVLCDEKRPLQHVRRNTSIQISSNRNLWNLWSAIWYSLMKLKIEKNSDSYYKIMTLMMGGMVSEIRTNKNRVLIQQAYQVMARYLISQEWSREFTDSIYNFYLNKMKEEPDDCSWVLNADRFYFRLKENEDLILAIVRDKNVVIWGNGQRSIAMQRIAKENALENIFVVDIKNDQIGERTRIGYKIKSTEEASACDVLIASNESIYTELLDNKKNKEMDFPMIINLQQYCPS